MMIRSTFFSRVVLPAFIFLVAGLPVFAQAGSPQLDPTNGSGTAYDFFVQGSSKPLDPSGGQGATGKLIGTMTITQGAGSPDFTADVLIDTNRDGTPTGSMTCEGFVGSGRVGMSCSGTDEDLNDIFVIILAKAVDRQGKIGLQAGKGLGFTDHSSLNFVFQGRQQ